MPQVTFLPFDKKQEVPVNGTLLGAARRAHLPLASACRSSGICKACRVQVLTGAESLSPLTELELAALRDGTLEPGERLACLARVRGPVTITTTYW